MGKKIKIKLNCSILLISILAALIAVGGHVILEQFEHHMHATEYIEEYTGKITPEFDELLHIHSSFLSHLQHQIETGGFTKVFFSPEKYELIMRLAILFSFSIFGFVISVIVYQKKQMKDNHENILESIDLSVEIIDKNWNLVFVNDAAARINKKTSAETVGKNIFKLFPTFKTSPFYEMVKNALINRISGRVADEYVHDDGRRMDQDTFAYPIKDGSIMIITYDVTNKVKLEKEKETLLHDLGERFKELNCLYSVSKIIEKPEIKLDEIFKKTIDIVQASWQYPEITSVKIKAIDKIYKTDNWEPSEWTQKSVITAEDESVGYIEVSYLEKCSESDEGPFMKEERKLINAIAERLGKVIERMSNKEDVNELRNLIPICSNCKSIRDDEGYYQTIEEYFTKHTDIELSHTVCDKCVRELYPEYADELLNGGRR